jgi:hypothetical protein
MVVKVPYGWKKLTRPAAMRFSLNHTGAPSYTSLTAAPVWPGCGPETLSRMESLAATAAAWNSVRTIPQ